MTTSTQPQLEVRSTPLVFASGKESEIKRLTERICQYQLFNSLRALKKLCRQGTPGLLLLYIFDDESYTLAEQAVEHIRLGLSNSDTRIVLIISEYTEFNPTEWSQRMGISALIYDRDEAFQANSITITREIENFERIESVRSQHNLEVQLLMSVARFSESGESFTEVLNHFSKCLGDVCASSISIQINIEKELGYIEKYSHNHIISKSDLSNVFNLPSLTQCLLKSTTEKKPQVSISADEFDVRSIGEKLGKEISGFLAFPIITYGRVMKILFYLISTSDMDKITVSRIDLITKAFDQLRVFLERSLAEQKLKEQYTRLKRALTKLKQTEEQLVQKEKLASVGKFAAGVAHEVNNPLAYVISNISSIDEYVNVIMKLQEMHAALINSINEGNTELCGKLKENINDFQKESGLAFILSDIKSVVEDSKEGLGRVKDIITDLQSFHGGFSGDSKKFDINDVIKKSIKLLKFDMQSINLEFNPIAEIISIDETDALHQVVDGILKNAIYSLEEAERSEKNIRITVIKEQSSIRIDFWDNGVGIASDIQDDIFDPFFTTKPVGSGKGMGLSLCYNLLNGLGGSISVDSELGQYANFSVLLPSKKD